METATTAKPRLRSDLVYQQLEVDGVVYVDVTDPNSGNTFRFYEVEYRIAEAMNGDRDMDGLVEYARSAIGVETNPDELGTVVSTLADLGYLDEARKTNGEGSYELGAAGKSELSPEPDASEFEPSGFELGAPGGTSDSDYDEPPTRVGGQVELGDPGKSPLAEAPRPRAGSAADVELGPAGGTAPREGVRTPAASLELAPVGTLDSARPRAASQVGTPEELSFDGLMEDGPTRAGSDALKAIPPVGKPPVPEKSNVVELTADEPSQVDAFAKRRTSVNLGEDNEPTNLPDAQPDPDDDEDVSVDLSAHLSLDRKEVQDAVRASKVVDVPAIPADLLKDADALDEDKTAARAPSGSPSGSMPLPAPPTTSSFSALEKSLESEPVVAPTGRVSDRPSTSRPVEPPPASKTAPVTAQKAPSGGGMKWVLLLVAVIGVGALVYFVAFGGEPATTQPTRPSPSAPGSDKGPAPSGDNRMGAPARPAPTAKLSERTAASVDLTAPVAGRVAWVEAAGADVIVDASVLKLVGYARWELQKKQALDRLAFYQDKLDKAKAANDAGKASAAQLKVEEKQGLVTQADTELAKVVVKATQAGKFEPLAKMNEMIAVGAVVAKIGGGAPQLIATFTGAPASLQPDSPCAVRAKGMPDKSTACYVETAEAGTIVVRLVDGAAGFAVGDEIELVPSK